MTQVERQTRITAIVIKLYCHITNRPLKTESVFSFKTASMTAIASIFVRAIGQGRM